MSPGIPQDTTLLDFNSENSMGVLRGGRAVGGHLTLAKRNSTPVGAGVPLGLLTGGRTGNNSGSSSSSSSSSVSSSSGSSSSSSSGSAPEHRRLDRCHSEPCNKGGNSSRYKTELCRPFEEHGFCKYGDKCQFAHGGNELRTLSRHPKYKTELCRTFHTIGFCPYGPRCHFIHNAEERRGHPPSHHDHDDHDLDSHHHDHDHHHHHHHHAHDSPAPSPTTPMSPRPLLAALTPTDCPSPPSSLHGSPTTPSAFFDDAFSLFPGCRRGRGILEGLTVGLPGMPHPHSQGPASPSHGGTLPGLDTPPVSPVESLAGDFDSLSLSSSHSASPTPHALLHAHAHALDINRSLRLPIFEQLCEHD